MPNTRDQRRRAAAKKIAAAFRAHLARRGNNVTTLNAIPGRRRVRIGTQNHDASSIAELMRRGNWRDPLTRRPLTNAQAAQAWMMHTRNRAAEARREGRQYAAQAMPHRPAGTEGIAQGRRDEIINWFFTNNAPRAHHAPLQSMRDQSMVFHRDTGALRPYMSTRPSRQARNTVSPARGRSVTVSPARNRPVQGRSVTVSPVRYRGQMPPSLHAERLRARLQQTSSRPGRPRHLEFISSDSEDF